MTLEAREARKAYQRAYRKRMTPEQREKYRDYNRRWRKQHPDRVRLYNTRYWNKRAEMANRATDRHDHHPLDTTTQAARKPVSVEIQ